MASYPGTPNKYPGTPNKYPNTPKVYPQSPAAYPAGAAAITVSQQFVVTAQPQTQGVIVVTQSFAVSGNPTTSPADLASIYGANLLAWSRADLVTIGASFSWNDKTGNGKVWTNATAAAGPSLTATDATLNNQPTLTFAAASSQYCDNSLALPAPGTTPTCVLLIMKQAAWVVNRSIIQDAGGSNRHTLIQSGTTPAISMVNTTAANNNTALTLSTWKLVTVSFTGSTSDYLKVGSTTVTGATAGNNASVGARRLAANGALSAFTSMSIAEIAYLKVTPSAGNVTSHEAYFSARYGASVIA